MYTLYTSQSNGRFLFIFLFFLFSFSCLSCALRASLPRTESNIPPRTEPNIPLHHKEMGLASWYGKDFHGRKTANGEVYDMYKNTAAHRYLPLGCFIRVTNLKNQKSLVVKVNDRGPFIKGRILDLSYGAACALAMAEDGLAPVQIELIEMPKEKELKGDLFIQIGAFGNKANAIRLQQHLSAYYQTHVLVYQVPNMATDIAKGSDMVKGSDITTWYRVWVGPFSHISLANITLQRLEAAGYSDSFIVAE